jgi:carbon storage regulator
MLVLSRKAGERISIGREIEVTVLGIRKGRVKLGFLGPPEVRIHREELLRLTPGTDLAGRTDSRGLSVY